MTAPGTPPAGWALRFVSGKYQGGLFPLRDGREVTIGRSGDVDLVLAEDNVSRRHAKLTVRGDDILLQDLGSTNGTCVNGERVKKATLREGDRVLVGSVILKVVRGEAGSAEATDAQIREALEAAAASHPRQASGMRGRLEEIPLPDLLQLLANAKKSGLLQLRDGERRADVHLHEGRISGCALLDRPALPSKKAFARLLSWDRGDFELRPLAEAPAAAIDEQVEAMLLEGMRQVDELQRISGAVPAPEARLAVPLPLGPPLAALAPSDLVVLQLAMNEGTAGAAVDLYPGPDVDAWKALQSLVEKGYLQIL